ncbi:MAG: type II secretion system F family protein [Candidatus Aenigmarchaeota archaeon]|nr:type II secretion system F family protein [Candidatus Aenigmarchaeota archaeon]
MVRFRTLIFVALSLYIASALVNYFYLTKVTDFASSLYIAFAVVIASPLVAIKYFENRKIKQIEQNFPVFLQDFVETIRGGMTVPQAFKAISNNEYGSLTPLVKKMSAQLDWGIPVEIVLRNFAKATSSKIISRVVSTVMESHKFGGKLTDTFEALSKTAIEVERLRAERRLFLNSQIVTGYIIYFVFLAVIIGLEKYLVPSLGQVPQTTLTAVGNTVNQANIAQEYKELFRNLIVMQGLFAGLTVGKMAEGALVSGVKHSIFMTVVGITVFLILG